MAENDPQQSKCRCLSMRNKIRMFPKIQKAPGSYPPGLIGRADNPTVASRLIHLTNPMLKEMPQAETWG